MLILDVDKFKKSEHMFACAVFIFQVIYLILGIVYVYLLPNEEVSGTKRKGIGKDNFINV